ncbi:MAG: hypothetical protein ABH860_04745 [bacterium]
MRKVILTTLILLCFSFAVFAQSLSHFNAGMEAFDNNKYGEAVKEFKLSLEEDPDSIESRYYYAISLYYKDEFEGAKSEFKKVAEKANDSPWGRSALSYMEAIDLGVYAPSPEKDFGGYFLLTYDSDDNTAYNQAIVADGQDNRSSTQLSLVYKPVVLSSRPVAISLNSFGSTYYKNTDYNEYGGSADASFYVPFLWGSSFTLSCGSGLDYLKYDQYYTNDYAEGRFIFNLFGESPAWTSIYGGGSDIFYKLASYEVYDSRDSKFGIRQNLNSFVYFEYLNRFSDTRSDDFAYRSDEYSIGTVMPLPFYFKLSTVARYMNKFFLYEDSIGRESRYDTSSSLDLLLSRDIIKGLTLGLKYAVMLYSSNLDSDETALGYGSYVDHVLSLSFSYRF